jgi:DNA-binding transcriptional ArsR family regulator
MKEYGYRECIEVKEFPPFIRVTLEGSARKELFSCVMKKVGTIRREYQTSENVFDALYGERKGLILQLLSEEPQKAKELIRASGLSPGVVYHFLRVLREQKIVSKKKQNYWLDHDFRVLTLDEIMKLEEDPASRRKYGISIKELELAHLLWEDFVKQDPQEKSYARIYHDKYTLADAVHRWRIGRTDIPVWALNRLAELSEKDIFHKITNYHLPPGASVNPCCGKYRIPIRVDSDLDKVVIQLLQKMSKNHLYTFPKKKEWLFEQLHTHFGEFDDSTGRIPSAIIEILKSYYRLETLKRSSACFPPRIKARWSEGNSLLQITEESSLLLHIISLSSYSNGGYEITSRSRPFLQDIISFVSGTKLGNLSLGKKRQRPHLRVYLSESKVAVLRRYAHIFQDYPDLEIWLRIPLNQIAEKVVAANALENVEQICWEELSQFVESILKSLERKSLERVDYLKYKKEVTDYFWKQKLIPSPRRVREMVEMRVQEENYLYA